MKFYEDSIPEAKFKVNGGITDSLEADEDYEFSDGISIAAREFYFEEAGEVTNDIVRFYFGSMKIVAKSNGDMLFNGEVVDELSGTGLASVIGTNPPRISLSEFGLIWATEDIVYVVKTIS